MSPAEVSTLLGFTVFSPFLFGILIAIFGRTHRARRVLCIACALTGAGFSFALLSGYLKTAGESGWGSLTLSPVTFPPFLMLNLVGAVVVLYAGLRRSERPSQGLLVATIPIGLGVAALAPLVSRLVSFVFLLEGFTLVVAVGLLAHGRERAKAAFVSFIPWLVSDGLFIVGAVLCGLWLSEGSVFIVPPLTSGSETKLILVMLLFLASALVRLGAFPLGFWLRDMTRRTDPAWSAGILGVANFVLAGFRLVIAATLVSRLVVTDWSTGLVIVGLVSILAGPLIAASARDVPGVLAGLYTMQGGFLVAGIGTFSRAGLDGALFCLLTAPIFLAAVFMAAGTADELRGSRELGRRGLSAAVAPGVFAALLVSGMSLAGLPPLDGFVGKALVSIGSLDKAAVNPLYALLAGLLLAGVAVACIAFARMVGGVFTSGTGGAAMTRRSSGEGFPAVLLCGASLLLGAVPGILLRNLTDPASRELFPADFSGPGVVFHASSVGAKQAISAYSSWAGAVAAFLLLAAVIGLVVYFASRAAHPSPAVGARVRPFVGGAGEEYFSQDDSVFGPWRVRLPFGGRRP